VICITPQMNTAVWTLNFRDFAAVDKLGFLESAELKHKVVWGVAGKQLTLELAHGFGTPTLFIKANETWGHL
jgi:hypothetical protein